jgi:Flp pilus assembly protein TadG
VTAIEFGFVGFIFFVLMLGAVDLARYQFTRQSLHDIAGEAARAALINASSVTSQQASGVSASFWSNSALKSAVTSPNLTPFLDPASLIVSTALVTSTSGVNTITVTVTYPFQFIGPLLPTPRLTLSDSAAISY